MQVNWPYERIMEAFDVPAVTTVAVRRAIVEQGVEVTLQGKARSRTERTNMFWMLKEKLISLPWWAVPEKKRAQAQAAGAMVYAPQSECSLCLPDGRCFGDLQAAL
jgi:hypothetical protein